MAKYETLKKEITERVKRGSSTFSKNVYNEMINGLINDAEYEYDAYSKKGNTFTTERRNPSKAFREAFKKSVKKGSGLPDADLGVYDTMEFPKSMGEAIGEIAGVSIKDYMETGKSFKIPATREDESVMQIYLRDKAEQVKATRKNEKQEDGTWKNVPTGKIMRTKKHRELVVKNKLPEWNKEDVTNKK